MSFLGGWGWVFQQVHRVFPSGLAFQEGTIQKGDEVLSINGKSLKAATHNAALEILRMARHPKVAVVVTRKPQEGERSLNASIDSSASLGSETSTDSSEYLITNHASSLQGQITLHVAPQH